MKPLVSIIIPVYNAEKFLAETIISALNQTWKNKEILIIDDGSTDTSFTVAKSFEAESVKVFHQSNRGASAARNLGIKEAKGDFIQFLDADDLLEETKIERQLAAINYSNNQLAICPAIHFPNGKFYRDFLPPASEISFYQNNYTPLDLLFKLYDLENSSVGMIALHAWLTPKELIKKAGFWNEDLTVDDDGEYFCRVVLAASQIVSTTETTCYYRKYQNRQSLSGQLTLKGFESRMQALDLKYLHLAAICDEGLVKKMLASHYWSIALLAYPKFKTLSAKAASQAKVGNYNGKKYSGGPASNFLSLFLGWRLTRYISFLRYGF